MSNLLIEEQNNIISESHQKYLYDLVTDIKFDWHHLDDVTFERTIDGTKTVPGFCNMIYQNGCSNQWFDVFYPILNEYLNRSGYQLNTLLRMRMGFLLNTVYSMPHLPYSYNNPHIDFEEPHFVGLYYLNTTDGDTVIFNETEKLQKYTVKKRIKPEMGKFVCFDGKQYHASTCPKVNTKRIVLTFNFSVK
jgi:hypothetical protein